MGFYTNIRSDVTFIKQVVDDIFSSKRHICQRPEFICIRSSEEGGFWYHVYRIDNFTIRIVRCNKTFRSNGSILGPSHHTETDESYLINLLEILDDLNNTQYQKFYDDYTHFKQYNISDVSSGWSIEVRFDKSEDDNNRLFLEFFIQTLSGITYNSPFKFPLFKKVQ